MITFGSRALPKAGSIKRWVQFLPTPSTPSTPSPSFSSPTDQSVGFFNKIQLSGQANIINFCIVLLTVFFASTYDDIPPPHTCLFSIYLTLLFMHTNFLFSFFQSFLCKPKIYIKHPHFSPTYHDPTNYFMSSKIALFHQLLQTLLFLLHA